MKTIFIEDKKIKVVFNIEPQLCIHVENSYTITKKQDIMDVLNFLHSTVEYQEMVDVGFSRTLKSQYEEWKAHNVLYKWGLFKSRVANVDINQSETPLRLFLYKILSLF